MGMMSLLGAPDGATLIPAPVAARAIRRQLEGGAFELYIPEAMRGFVASRSRDVAGGIEFMAGLFREGRLH